MKRRDMVLGAAAGLAQAPVWSLTTAAATPGVSSTEVLIGQTAVLSGPMSPGVLAAQGGSKLVFDAANAQGGIHGRQIRLVSLDDGLDPARAKENYEQLVLKQRVFACFGGIGNGTTQAGLPIMREYGVPLLGSYAVADSVRDQGKGVAYYTRASQLREAEVFVKHMQALGYERVAVVKFGTPAGNETHKQLLALMDKAKLKLVGTGDVLPNGSNAADVGKSLAALQANAIIMFVAGNLAATVMSAVWAAGATPSFYGSSILSSGVPPAILVGAGRSLAILQMAPYPWDLTNPEAQAYRAAAEAAKVPVGYASYSGYIEAKVLLEAIKQCGADPTRSKLHAVMRKLKMRVATQEIDFSAGGHTGSRFVELVQLRADGKFVR